MGGTCRGDKRRTVRVSLTQSCRNKKKQGQNHTERKKIHRYPVAQEGNRVSEDEIEHNIESACGDDHHGRCPCAHEGWDESSHRRCNRRIMAQASPEKKSKEDMAKTYTAI